MRCHDSRCVLRSHLLPVLMTTFFRNLRRGAAATRLKRALRGLDQFVAGVAGRVAANGARRHILFEVFNGIGVAAQAPVMLELQHRGCQVSAASGALTPAALEDLLRQHGVDPSVVIPERQARHGRFDLKVVSDAPVIRSWRVATVAYLHHGTSFANSADPFALGVLRVGDVTHLLALSEAEVELGRRRLGPDLGARMRVTGQPKLDQLLHGDFDRAAFLRSLGLAPDRQTVLIASHWRPESLFRSTNLQPLARYAASCGHNVLVTAHPRLLDEGVDGSDWRAQLQQRFQGPAIRVVDSVPSSRALLRTADVLLCDFSSIRVEFATLFRPIVIVQHQAMSWSDPRLRDLWHATADFLEPGDDVGTHIEAALARGLDEPAARTRLLDYALEYLGTSTSRTADVILSLP